jgi:SAM-dependent methyltransferase
VTADPIDRYAQAHLQLGELAAEPAILRTAIHKAAVSRLRTVDVGCGEGQTLALLRSAGSSVGVERSAHRAVVAARRGFPVLVADGARLPLADASVGFLVCRHVVEHVDDDAAFLIELRRVLAPSGMLYLETPLRLPAAWYPYRGPTGDRVLDPTHVREYRSVAHVRALLEAAGFPSTTFEVVPLTYSAGHMLARLLLRLGVRGRLPDRVAASSRMRIRIPRYREIRALSAPGE